MRRGLCAAAAAAVLVTVAPRAQEPPDARVAPEHVGEAAAVLSAIVSADETIPRAVLEKAEAIAVFPYAPRRPSRRGQGPNTRRAERTFGIRARGVASVRERDGWSAPAFLTIVGGAPQTGDLVLVATSRRGVDQLLASRFELKDPGVRTETLGPAAAPASIDPDAAILVFARPRASKVPQVLDAAAVQPDREATIYVYGKELTGPQAVALVNPPASVAPWRAALEKHARR